MLDLGVFGDYFIIWYCDDRRWLSTKYIKILVDAVFVFVSVIVEVGDYWGFV